MNFILKASKAAALCLLLAVTSSALASTYYIDYNSGSDSNSGTSTTAPWKIHPYMKGFSGSYSHQAGDRFIFKGGVTWPASVLPLLYTSGAGGASGNPDYYGVDKTYYTGSSWTRPILNGGGAASVAFWLVNYNNITIDNFDFTNFGMTGGIINAYRSTGITIKNGFFHNWTRAGFSTDDLKCINGDSSQPFSGNVIDGCIFTGSPNATDSGMAVYHWSGDIINCIATNLSNGFLPNSGMVSNCLVGPINDSFDPNQHENSIEQLGSGRMDICYNVIRNATAVCIFTGNPGGPTYVYNNLIYNSQPIPIQFDGRGGGFNAYVYNNTVVSTETGSAMRCVGSASVTLYAYNNHLIDGGITSTFAGVNQGNNLAQTLSQAASAGYTSANGWKPTGSAAPTVDKGVATTIFSKDLLLISRPQGGGWDIGAYEYGGMATTNNTPPTVSAIFQNGSDVNPILAGLQVLEGTVVQYSGSAADANGDLLAWQWIYTINGGAEVIQQSGSGTVTPLTFVYGSGTAGKSYVWKLRVSDGQSSSESQTTLTVDAAPVAGGGLAFEAESGVVSAPFVVSGGGISQATQTDVTSGGRAVYSFTVTNAGNYVIQALVNTPSEAGNSFYVNVDGEPQDPAMIWQIPLTSGFENRIVSWQGTGTFDNPQFVPKRFSLSLGNHQLIIRGREANTQLDRISILKFITPPSNMRSANGP